MYRPKVDDGRWEAFFAALSTGCTRHAAAKQIGISLPTVDRLFHSPSTAPSGFPQYQAWLRSGGNDPIPYSKLRGPEKAALTDFGLFRERYFGHVSRPWHIEAGEQVEKLLLTAQKEFVVINVPPGTGKALALDTPILTTAGWSTMGDLQVGDFVFGADGKPTMVAFTSEVFNDHDCYRVDVSDGGSIVADADHLWWVSQAGRHDWRTRTTEFVGQPSRVKARGGESRRKRLQIPVNGALDLPEADLVVDPYLLGVWLGDGCWQTSSVSMTAADGAEVRPYFEKEGYRTTDRNHPFQFGVTGFKQELPLIGLGERIKYVPREYLMASAGQRMALLQGLMDTDGHARPDGLCEFTNTRKSLVDAVAFLARSLGAKVTVRTTTTECSRRDKHDARFYLPGCFRIARKRICSERALHQRSTRRGITATRVESVPTRCIQVSNADGLFLAGENLTVTHNTTLWSHDIPVWLAVKNRAVRCLLGTGAETMGQDYTQRIKLTLERDTPIEASDYEKRLGLAVDAKACLAYDYGRFKPDSQFMWRNDKLLVARHNGAVSNQKEATFQSYGRRSNFLGGRYEYSIWDDVVTDQNSRDLDEQAKLVRWWRNTAESRVEPGGLIILMGQRLGPFDLYAHTFDLRDMAASWDGHYEDADGNVDMERLPKKYTRITYKAHYEDKCLGEDPRAEHHHPDTAKAWPQGCLLDPIRLTQRDLLNIKADDPQTFSTVYQQEDGNAESALVQPLWVNGGVGVDGQMYPGCWDVDRQHGVWPKGLAGQVYSVVTADPSPSNFWGVHWWAYQVDNQFQHLLDLQRKKMGAPDLLDWNHASGAWTGMLEEWWQRSNDQGHPITHVIIEANAAQKFLLQYDHARRWAMTRGVQLIAHQTQRNKTDPDYGVTSLGPHYKFGRVRLPGHPQSRVYAMPLVAEVTRYPHSGTTDQVMAHWFLTWNSHRLFVKQLDKPYSFNRPSWAQERQRGLRAV